MFRTSQTCKSIENRKSKICTKPILSSTYIEESKSDICNKAFKGKGNLKRHKMVHLPEKLYFCEICRMGLGKQKYKQHCSAHYKGGDFKCGICCKEFPDAQSYNKHCSLIHLVNRTNKCNFCNQGFFHQIGLKKHFLMHSSSSNFFVMNGESHLLRIRNSLRKSQ